MVVVAHPESKAAASTDSTRQALSIRCATVIVEQNSRNTLLLLNKRLCKNMLNTHAAVRIFYQRPDIMFMEKAI
jgi:hypothetical protein